MSEADNIFHDPETGQNYYNAPGNRLIPVTDAEVAEIKRSVPIFLRALGDSGGRIATGIADLLTRDDSPQGQVIQQEQDAIAARESARRLVSPAGQMAGGAVLPLAVGVGGGVAAGVGRTALGTIGRQATVEATLGAVYDADNPLRGAAIGAALGGGLAGAGVAGAAAMRGARNSGMPARVAERLRGTAAQGRQSIDDSLSAARTGPDAPVYQGRRVLSGFRTAEQMDDLDVPLTPGDRLALEARNAEDKALFQRVRSAEELARSDDPLSATGAFTRGGRIEDIRQAQRADFTRRLGSMLGDPNIENLTRANRAELRQEVQKVFQRYIDDGTEPIPGTELQQRVAKIAELSSGNAQARMASVAEEVASKVGPDGAFDRDAFSSVRSEIRKDMEQAFAGGNYELGSALSQAMEAMDDALEATLDDAAKEALSEARLRWRLLKALERRRVTDPGGEINPRTFQAAYEAVTPRFKRAAGGRDRITEFESLLDTMVFLTTKTQPDSGTAQRLLRNLGNRVNAGNVIAGGLAAAGLSILN